MHAVTGNLGIAALPIGVAILSCCLALFNISVLFPLLRFGVRKRTARASQRVYRIDPPVFERIMAYLKRAQWGVTGVLLLTLAAIEIRSAC